MNQSKIYKSRHCKTCDKEIYSNAAGLREHYLDHSRLIKTHKDVFTPKIEAYPASALADITKMAMKRVAGR